MQLVSELYRFMQESNFKNIDSLGEIEVLKVGNARLIAYEIYVNEASSPETFLTASLRESCLRVLDNAILQLPGLELAHDRYFIYFFKKPAKVWLAREVIGHCTDEELESVQDLYADFEAESRKSLRLLDTSKGEVLAINLKQEKDPFFQLSSKSLGEQILNTQTQAHELLNEILPAFEKSKQAKGQKCTDCEVAGVWRLKVEPFKKLASEIPGSRRQIPQIELSISCHCD